ncbi:MAG: Clp1/GlmU family protein [bacterium]|nr:Clp1/GlmU family protein [bacterium]
MHSIIPLPEWKPIVDEILTSPGIVMLFGAIDTGKSSFAKYLIQQGIEKKLKVGLVDSDMGQSTLGPPCTIGMTIFDDNCKLQTATRKIFLHFIGATSPVGHLLTTVVGVKKLVEKATSHSAKLLIVDTTGLVYGDAAKELKFRKVELVRPHYLVAFQRNAEIEPLLIPQEKAGRTKVYRLPVSEKVNPRTPEERRGYREKKFADYFSSAHLIEIPITQFGFHNFWFNTGRKLNQNEYNFLEKILDTAVLYGEKIGNTLNLIISGGFDRSEQYKLEAHFGIANLELVEYDQLQNLLVGLNNQNNETLALGLIQDIEPDKSGLKMLTPLSELTSIRIIEFGFIRIDSKGKEIGKNS